MRCPGEPWSIKDDEDCVVGHLYSGLRSVCIDVIQRLDEQWEWIVAKIVVFHVTATIAEFVAIFANAISAADVCKRGYLLNAGQFAIRA